MYRILELLRRQEGFLSGEDIGRELSITRAAVWKGIKKLREEGYEIEAVTNRGYRLTNPETMYNKRELEQGLKTKTMGQSIYFYEETDTTNNRARELALEGAPEGTLVVAEKQTAGRGRRGKVWESPLGTGIWMSLVLRPQIMPAEASVLTLLCGLATAEAIEYIGQEDSIYRGTVDLEPYVGGYNCAKILYKYATEGIPAEQQIEMLNYKPVPKQDVLDGTFKAVQ